MFNLHIIDVSALLHFGMSSTRYKDKTSYGFHNGGILRVLRTISQALANDDDVILAFDSKSNFRKKIMPDYKAGRVPNKSVLLQADILYEYLSGAGFMCYRQEGFEGDDVINWCTSLAPAYSRVYIHGNDRDLIHNVRANVIFRSITDEINSVTEGTFPYAIERGSVVPFNFISVKKVLTGCSSDKVPAFTMENGTKGAEIFEWYLQALDFKKVPYVYENTANKKLFLTFMEYVPGITENDLENLKKRVDVIFPADKPESFCPEAIGKRKVDMHLFRAFLSLMADYESCRCLRLNRKDLNDDEKNQLREWERCLTSGEFAVDRNMVVNDSYDDGLLTLKEF